MLDDLPIYFWFIPAALCGAAGFVWHVKRKARLSRRNTIYDRAFGKKETPEPVKPPRAAAAVAAAAAAEDNSEHFASSAQLQAREAAAAALSQEDSAQMAEPEGYVPSGFVTRSGYVNPEPEPEDHSGLVFGASATHGAADQSNQADEPQVVEAVATQAAYHDDERFDTEVPETGHPGQIAMEASAYHEESGHQAYDAPAAAHEAGSLLHYASDYLDDQAVAAAAVIDEEPELAPVIEESQLAAAEPVYEEPEFDAPAPVADEVEAAPAAGSLLDYADADELVAEAEELVPEVPAEIIVEAADEMNVAAEEEAFVLPVEPEPVAEQPLAYEVEEFEQASPVAEEVEVAPAAGSLLDYADADELIAEAEELVAEAPAEIIVETAEDLIVAAEEEAIVLPEQPYEAEEFEQASPVAEEVEVAPAAGSLLDYADADELIAEAEELVAEAPAEIVVEAADEVIVAAEEEVIALPVEPEPVAEQPLAYEVEEIEQASPVVEDVEAAPAAGSLLDYAPEEDEVPAVAHQVEAVATDEAAEEPAVAVMLEDEAAASTVEAFENGTEIQYYSDAPAQTADVAPVDAVAYEAPAVAEPAYDVSHAATPAYAASHEADSLSGYADEQTAAPVEPVQELAPEPVAPVMPTPVVQPPMAPAPAAKAPFFVPQAPPMAYEPEPAPYQPPAPAQQYAPPPAPAQHYAPPPAPAQHYAPPPAEPAPAPKASRSLLGALKSRITGSGKKDDSERSEGAFQALTKNLTRGTTLPKAYDRGVVMLNAPPSSIERGAKAEFLLPWAIAQARGKDVAPAYADLSPKEIRLVELALETVNAGDRAFTTLKGRLDATERAYVENLRPMAKADPRDTLEKLHSKVKSRVNKLLKATKSKAAPVVESSEPTRRPFMHASEMFYWLPATNDPDLWHILMGGLDFSTEEMLPVVRWIIENPACDQATAALAMIRIDAETEAQNDSTRGRYGYEAEVWKICQTICERAMNGEYQTRTYNLSCVGIANDQSDYPGKLAAVAHKNRIPWPDPTELFATPFDGRDAYSARFELLGDTLYHRSAMAAA